MPYLHSFLAYYCSFPSRFSPLSTITFTSSSSRHNIIQYNNRDSNAVLVKTGTHWNPKKRLSSFYHYDAASQIIMGADLATVSLLDWLILRYSVASEMRAQHERCLVACVVLRSSGMCDCDCDCDFQFLIHFFFNEQPRILFLFFDTTGFGGSFGVKVKKASTIAQTSH